MRRRDLEALERAFPRWHRTGCAGGHGPCGCGCPCHGWARAVEAWVVSDRMRLLGTARAVPVSGIIGPGHLTIQLQPGGPGAPAPHRTSITQAEAMADVRRQLQRGQRR